MKAKFGLNVNLNYIKSLLQERESQSYIAHGPLITTRFSLQTSHKIRKQISHFSSQENHSNRITIFTRALTRISLIHSPSNT